MKDSKIFQVQFAPWRFQTLTKYQHICCTCVTGTMPSHRSCSSCAIMRWGRSVSRLNWTVNTSEIAKEKPFKPKAPAANGLWTTVLCYGDWNRYVGKKLPKHCNYTKAQLFRPQNKTCRIENGSMTRAYCTFISLQCWWETYSITQVPTCSPKLTIWNNEQFFVPRKVLLNHFWGYHCIHFISVGLPFLQKQTARF